MRAGVAALVAAGASLIAATTGAEEVESDAAALADFLAGEYVLVGNALESEDTFLGRVSLTSGGGKLTGYREVDGRRFEATGALDRPKCCDNTVRLTLRFSVENKNFEGSYLWQSDLDNNPRLTGYVYELGVETTSPGLEVMFLDRF